MAEKKITLETTLGELIPAGKACSDLDIDKPACVFLSFDENDAICCLESDQTLAQSYTVIFKSPNCPRPAEAV